MLKIFETFAGYGGASFALKKARIPFECVGYSEINKYAIQCYEQNHKGVKNFGSIKDIDPNKLPDFDVLTGGFPCQDVSLAGNRDLTKGRTMLINDVFRIIKVKKPKYVVLENVRGLLSMKELWDGIRHTLQKLGYGVSYKILNSKEHGIPQNRERIFIICKFGGWEFMEFMFPTPIKLNLFVKDILEKKVDKKYNLSEKSIKKMIEHKKRNKENGNGFGASWFDGSETHFNTIRAGDNLQYINVHSLQSRSADRPSLTKECPCGSKKLYQKCCGVPSGTGHLSKDDGTIFCLDSANSQAIEIIGGLQDHQIFRKDGVSPRLTKAMGDGGGHTPIINKVSPCLTTELSHSTGKDWNALRFKKVTGEFRRLTPKECFRLMGFVDDNINLEGLSNTQCYKLAGNGWDVNLVSKIFKNLIGDKY
jgi:DNA-cytosine methyltransferase